MDMGPGKPHQLDGYSHSNWPPEVGLKLLYFYLNEGFVAFVDLLFNEVSVGIGVLVIVFSHVFPYTENGRYMHKMTTSLNVRKNISF